MSDKSASAPAAKSKAAPAYISSSGQTLSSLPVTARANNFITSAYNFLGLYLVSLLSLDPYRAAQNSQFNTRGPGRDTGSAQPRSNPGPSGLFGGGRLGGGGPSGSSGPRGGGPRMGTVDDVRGSECGSCG